MRNKPEDEDPLDTANLWLEQILDNVREGWWKLSGLPDVGATWRIYVRQILGEAKHWRHLAAEMSDADVQIEAFQAKLQALLDESLRHQIAANDAAKAGDEAASKALIEKSRECWFAADEMDKDRLHSKVWRKYERERGGPETN